MSTFEPRFTITNAITAGLTAIERARGGLQGATLSEEWAPRMSQRGLLLEAHHTTHIESTHFTLEQSERVWAARGPRHQLRRGDWRPKVGIADHVWSIEEVVELLSLMSFRCIIAPTKVRRP